MYIVEVSRSYGMTGTHADIIGYHREGSEFFEADIKFASKIESEQARELATYYTAFGYRTKVLHVKADIDGNPIYEPISIV